MRKLLFAAWIVTATATPGMAGGYGYDYYPPAHYYPPPPACGDYGGYAPPTATCCGQNQSNVSVIVNNQQMAGRQGCHNGWCSSPRAPYYPPYGYDYPLK